MNNASETGLNIFELKSLEIVDSKDFTKAIAIMQSNYSTEYSHEKVALLFDMITEEKWSRDRFLATFKWILKNRKYADWTIADWFAYSIRVYPYSWYLKQVLEKGASINNQIEVYKLSDGTEVYKYIDGCELPYEKRKIGEGLKRPAIICSECHKPITEKGCPECESGNVIYMAEEVKKLAKEIHRNDL